MSRNGRNSFPNGENKRPSPDVSYQDIRTWYESTPNATLRAAAERYGVAFKVVSSIAANEKWTPSLRLRLANATELAIIGLPATTDPEKLQQSVEEEAAKRAEVMWRLRKEWGPLDELRAGVMRKLAEYEGVYEQASELLAKAVRGQGEYEDAMTLLDVAETILKHAERLGRTTKIQCEALQIQQGCTRRNWGLDIQVQVSDEADRMHDEIALRRRRLAEIRESAA